MSALRPLARRALCLAVSHTDWATAQARSRLPGRRPRYSPPHRPAARIAAAYWRAFRDLGLRERKGGDLPRSWLRFANRQKGVQFLGSKHASHPINAMLNYAYVVEAGRLARALTAAGFALPIGFLHSDKHGRNSLVWDAIEPLRPLIDARVFKFIAQREFVRSDFPQAGRNAHRIDRAIIAELLRVSLLSWERHEDAARWMERTIADAVKQRLRD